MSIRKIVIGTAFLSVAMTGNANSADLLCKGRGWVVAGGGFEDSVLVKIQPKTLQTALTMTRGTANGILAADPKIYKGMLSLTNGERVWINLDRYTGDLIVAPPSEVKGQPVIFVGACEEAKPKF